MPDTSYNNWVDLLDEQRKVIDELEIELKSLGMMNAQQQATISEYQAREDDQSREIVTLKACIRKQKKANHGPYQENGELLDKIRSLNGRIRGLEMQIQSQKKQIARAADMLRAQEEEVGRLKRSYGAICQQRNSLEVEVEKLREQIRSAAIQADHLRTTLDPEEDD